MYDDWRPENRNAFNVENDTQLSAVSKSVGLVKLPAGQADNSAVDYIPELAKLWNESTPEDIHFIDAYQLTKSSVSPKEYVSSLLKKYRRVIILTCEKLMVGTDIPQIGHIILFDKISSADSFEQLIGRSIRTLDGKKSVVLYNMCPGSEIRLTLGEMVNRSAKLSGGKIQEKCLIISLSLSTLQSKMEFLFPTKKFKILFSSTIKVFLGTLFMYLLCTLLLESSNLLSGIL
jgi:hypothetical protein